MDDHVYNWTDAACAVVTLVSFIGIGVMLAWRG
jgi:hypothetical protein